MFLEKKKVAVVGTGPAGLMAANVLADAGHCVFVFDAHHSPGRKLLIAGKSGLNVAHQTQTPAWHANSLPKKNAPRFKNWVQCFSLKDWLDFLHALGIATFVGTSRRYFVSGLKAAPLLKAWVTRLKKQNVQFFYRKELTDFFCTQRKVHLTFHHTETLTFDCAILALGGASWLSQKQNLWSVFFAQKKIKMAPFRPANAGFFVDWSKEFLQEVEGCALKNIVLKTKNAQHAGELTITRYGLEGTPVYNLQKAQTVYLDLKPDLSIGQMLKKFARNQKNLSPLRLVKKYLNLSPPALALLFHHTPQEKKANAAALCAHLKNFPVVLKAQRGLEDAISSLGGVCFSELNFDLMLKNFPGIFLAGEMLDWTAPTGGFLIHTSVTQGHAAGLAAREFLLVSANH